jgi:ADP-ribosylglycohydrolase
MIISVSLELTLKLILKNYMVINIFKQMNRIDRIKGLLIGGALGDALGAPHEFKYSERNYSGRLEHKAKIFNRFTNVTKYLQVGQVTDDTEMMLIITRRLIEDNKYIRDNILHDYMSWASNAFAMGRNTRALFKGIKTIKGYEKRVEKLMNDSNQSNGSLMRSGIFFIRPLEEALLDCSLTNDTSINLECQKIFHILGSEVMNGRSKEELETILLEIKIKNKEVKFAVNHALYGFKRDMTQVKGWVVHGLYAAIYSLFNFDDYSEPINYFASLYGSDTDTNACIVGYLLGAFYGYEKIKSERMNDVNLLISCQTDDSDFPRDKRYRLNDIDQLVEELNRL